MNFCPLLQTGSENPQVVELMPVPHMRDPECAPWYRKTPSALSGVLVFSPPLQLSVAPIF